MLEGQELVLPTIVDLYWAHCHGASVGSDKQELDRYNKLVERKGKANVEKAMMENDDIKRYMLATLRCHSPYTPERDSLWRKCCSELISRYGADIARKTMEYVMSKGYILESIRGEDDTDSLTDDDLWEAYTQDKKEHRHPIQIVVDFNEEDFVDHYYSIFLNLVETTSKL